MTASTRASSRSSRKPVGSRWSGPGSPLRAAAPALLLYAAVRLVYLLLVLAASPHGPGESLHLLGTHWDANQYLNIARYGYHPATSPGRAGAGMSNLAFFPLFPALMAALHAVLPFLPWSAVGPVVATLASLAAAWGIFAALAPGYGRRTATLTVVMWGLVPAAVVENAGYSESLFTAFAAWSLWAVVTRRWLTAGVLSLLAGLTRPTAVALAAAVIAATAVELHRRRRDGRGAADESPVRLIAAALLAPLGWLGYVAWTAHALHSWSGYFQVQAQWHSRFDFGASTLHDVWLVFSSGSSLNTYYPIVACVLAAAAVLALCLVVRRDPPALVVYGLLTLAITLGDSAYLSSRPRFLLPAFPLLLPLAALVNRLGNRVIANTALACALVGSACFGAYVFFLSPGAP